MKYYFWILGCAMNYSDAERIAAVLDNLGYQKTENEMEADFFIVISCSVRQSAINRINGKVKDLNELRVTRKEKREGFTTILSGCVLEKDKKKLSKVFDIMLEIEELEKLPGLLSKGNPEQPLSRHPSDLSSVALAKLEGWDSGREAEILNQVQDDNVRSGDYLSIQPRYESSFRAYVPISAGCDNFCSYCAVPYTRGREKSRPMKEVVAEVKSLAENGYKEITLLGQNVNSYGKGLQPHASSLEEQQSSIMSLQGTKQSLTSEGDCRVDFSQKAPRNDGGDFIELLKKLDAISGNHRIYFYSNHPKDMTDELIGTLAALKHFPHYIHLPLQSGNDEILRKMNRHTTQRQYLDLVKRIRTAMPDVNLTTDIIVGYPGETEQQFEDTAKVMREAEYDMAFIAQYSPRAGTLSAKQPDDVTKEEKKRREDILQQILAETVLAHNQKLVGTIQRVLIDEVKNDKLYGRTEGYKVVEIDTNVIPGHKPGTQPQTAEKDPRIRKDDKVNKTDQPLAVGQYIDVTIDSVSSWKLFGTLLAPSE